MVKHANEGGARAVFAARRPVCGPVRCPGARHADRGASGPFLHVLAFPTREATGPSYQAETV